MSKIIALLLLLGMLYTNAAYSSMKHDPIEDSLSNIYYEVIPAGNFYIVNQGLSSTIFNRKGKPMFPFKYKKIKQGLRTNFIADNLLIDTNGVILHEFRYPFITADKTNNLYKQEDNGFNKGTADANGNDIIYPCSVAQYNVGLMSFSIDNRYDYTQTKYGVKDTVGKIIVPAKYTNVTTGSNYIGAWENDTAYLFNKTGKMLFSCRADAINIFPQDFIAIELYGLWALKDPSGKTLTPFKYTTIRDFGSKDIIKADNGLVNRKGIELLPSLYSEPYLEPGGWVRTYSGEGVVFDNNYKKAFQKGEYSEITFTGNRYLTLSKSYEDQAPKYYDKVSRKYVDFKIENALANDAYVIIKPNGQKAIIKDNKDLRLPAFNKVENIEYTPYYLISQENKTGLFNEDIFTGQKTEATSKISGLLDKNNKLILPIKYQNISLHYASKTISAYDNKKSYLFNMNGKQLASFDQIINFQDGSYITSIYYKGRTIFVDSTGIIYNQKKNASLAYLHRQYENTLGYPSLIITTDSQGNSGIYDMHGKLLQKPDYYIVNEKAPGIITLKKNDSLYFINYKGKMLFKGRGFDGRNCKLLEGVAVIIKDYTNHWGILDAACNIVEPFIYDTVFADNRTNNYVLGKDKLFAPVDNTGKLIYPLQSNVNNITVSNIKRDADGHYYKNDVKGKIDMGTAIPDALFKQYTANNNQPIIRIFNNVQGIPQGLYNQEGEFLAPVFADFNNYMFNAGTLITDSSHKKIAVIKEDGRMIIPLIDTPRLLIVNYNSAIAIYHDKSLLFRFINDTTRVNEISIDSNDKAVFLKEGANYKVLNNKNLFFSAEGIKKGIACSVGPTLWDAEIDSVRQIGYNFAIKKNSKWGIVSAYCNWLVEPICDSMHINGEYISLYKDHKEGIYDCPKRITILPRYDKVFNPQTLDSRFIVVKTGTEFYIINSNMETISTAFDSISTKAWALKDIPAVKSGQQFLLSLGENGQIISKYKDGEQQKTDENGNLGDIVIATEKGKKGLYSNITHKWLQQPVYDIFRYNSDDDDEYTANKYSANKEKVIDSTWLISSEGKIILSLKGLCYPERINNKLWTLGYGHTPPAVNKKGKVVVPESYRDVEQSGELLIAKQTAEAGNKTAILNENGTLITLPILDEVENVMNGYLIGTIDPGEEKELTYCLINPRGKIVNSARYKKIMPFEPEPATPPYIFYVMKDSLWGAIDGNGKSIIPCGYDSILQVYKNKIAIVKKKNSKWGLVNNQGKTLAPFIYDFILQFIDDKAYFYSGNKSRWLDMMGKPHIEEQLNPEKK